MCFIGYELTAILMTSVISIWIWTIYSIIDGFMMFNATFNNISVITWWSVYFGGGNKVPGENHRPVVSHWQTSSHNDVSSTPRHERGSNSQL